MLLIRIILEFGQIFFGPRNESSVGISIEELFGSEASVAAEEILPERVAVKGPKLKVGSNLNGREKRDSSTMIKWEF